MEKPKYQALRDCYVEKAYVRQGGTFHSDGEPGDAWLPINDAARARKTGGATTAEELEAKRTAGILDARDAARHIAPQKSPAQGTDNASEKEAHSAANEGDTILTGSGAPGASTDVNQTGTAESNATAGANKEAGTAGDVVKLDEEPTEKDGTWWATKDGIMFEVDRRTVRDDLTLTPKGVEAWKAAKAAH